MELIKKIGTRKTPKGYTEIYGLFYCARCGEYVEREIRSADKYKTCGCFIRDRKHGYWGTRIYWVWHSMKDRCCNKKNKKYKYYGGRGIKVSKEWETPKNFCDWSFKNGYKHGLEIDRIDNDGDYCPDNCRWVTRKKNVRNSNKAKLTEESVSEIRKIYKKNMFTYKQLSKMYSVSESTIGNVIRKKTWA